MGEVSSTQTLYNELEQFVHDKLVETEDFATFVAIFDEPDLLHEADFDHWLWRRLDALHQIDRLRYPQAGDCDPDPESPTYAFSLIGHPFYVVGMHPAASRITRRSVLPTLAFNSHRQFSRLKASGTYQGLQKRIRERELRLQNSINPALADFGESSEARQYSGVMQHEEWQCPIQPSL
jgi:FPC/CPF motif-containing protein YcgG